MASICMSLVRNGLYSNCLRKSMLLGRPLTSIYQATPSQTSSWRNFHRSTPQMNEEGLEEEENVEEVNQLAMPEIDPQTSIRYMKSNSYKTTYGDTPVWVPYRRNHKGAIAPKKTRKMCIRAGLLATGNPCPICRDKYLVVNENNVDLLKQFLSEFSGELLSYEKTGVCQEQHKKLMIAVEKARDIGLIDKPVPFRQYDYSEYYPDLKAKSSA